MATARIGLEAARTIGDRRGEAEALESLGKAHFQARQLTEAARFHQAALAIRTDIGDDYGTAVSINALGLLGLRHRRLDEARTHFQKSLAIFERLGNRRWQALLLSNIAEAAYETGDLTGVVTLLENAVAVQREIGDEGQEGNSLFFLSMSLRELGRLDDARQAITRALDIADKHTNRLWTAHWLVEYARLERASGRPAIALEAAHRAATIQRTIGDQNREALALDEAGEAYRDSASRRKPSPSIGVQSPSTGNSTTPGNSHSHSATSPSTWPRTAAPRRPGNTGEKPIPYWPAFPTSEPPTPASTSTGSCRISDGDPGTEPIDRHGITTSRILSRTLQLRRPQERWSTAMRWVAHRRGPARTHRSRR
nr:tetratricopeptide repeat protein [Actinoplanes sp. NBRC 101535]